MAGSASCLVFYVNGKKVTDRAPDPELTLLRYLREKLRLCGTKLGCAEGGCGACTVMISKLDRSSGSVKHFAVNACLAPICSVHGLAVTTVEGIGSTKTRLHPVQERIAKAHGSQCGFCTPGIVMSMYALLRSSPKPNMKDLEVAFQGNLCRCTGYRPIIEGYRTFTDNACGMGEKCCKLSGNECGVEIDDKLFEPSEFTPLDPSQEPIFPPELKLNDAYDTETLTFTSERNVVWFRPTSLAELLQFKKNQPEAKIVVGNTEVGIEVKSKNFDYKFLVNPTHIKELKAITLTDGGMKVGSAVTLMELQEALQEQIEALPEHETRLYRAIVEMLHWFAGKQIRNVASVGGNIMTGSPISDLNPIFMAASTSLEVESLEGGKRNVKMDGNFFSAYRKNIIDDAEVLISLFIPRTSASQHFLANKQAKRRDDDIAIVNGAFYVRFVEGTNIVEETQFAFGGMAATTVLTPQTSANVKGRAWDRNLIELVNKSFVAELPLSADAPGGMILYRRSLTLSLFFKAFLSIGQSLEATLGLSLVDERERSGADNFHTLPAKSTQLFEKVSADQPSTDPIRRPKIHSSGLKQATGEAIYCDDVPKHANELYLSFVLSTKAHAKLISLDASEALKLEGVHAFFCAKDLPSEQNTMGPMYIDEEVFISEVVTSHGQLLAAIAADSQMIAQRAAKLVKVVYEEISPVIVSIDDAIKFDSYFPGYPKITESGNVHKAFEEADHQASGELRVGGQEHFYLETHSCVAIPKDTDELEVFSSTQQPADLQRRIALLLQIPMNRVVLRVKRIGGGFGGKETRAGVIALPVAWAAWKLGRPIRIMLDRDEDMLITGGRNPFLFTYKAAFNANGKITGCDIEAFNNAGYSMDYSFLVMEKAMQGMTNAYNIPNVRIKSAVMKTNLPSNTAFRGFGSPQGMLLAEHVIRHVAKVTQRDYLEVMAINMCRTGDVTHFGQLLESCMNVRCFEEVKKSAELDRRSLEVDEFNLRNRWKKRGISLTNTMFGVGFPPKFLNQGGALINIYVDGSVLIAHGGVEMGQGLHIKMIQIASNLLKIPIEKFHVQETSTDKVPNAVSTAASVSSDLYGGAVIEACNILNSRLAPFREDFAELGWDKMIFKAYFERVSLSATGYFATPDIGPEIGKPNNYFTHGAAVTEVEIDCLTGDHQTVRTDIVMDIGSSLNPAIDIGQIEGAFMQGYGMFTLEELIYSPEGALLSRGPSTYKVPGFGDIPAEFNVSLLTGAPNPRACYSSKAVGEPPLFLASSAFFAIKEAISAARKEENLDPDFYMPSPATSARIRMACQDEITKNFDEPEEGSFKPWNVVP